MRNQSVLTGEPMGRAETVSPSEGSGPTSQQQRETAQYISDMVLELRTMAKAAHLYTVMVPLEYSYYEAFSVAHQVHVPPGELQRLRELSQALKDLEPQTPPVE